MCFLPCALFIRKPYTKAQLKQQSKKQNRFFFHWKNFGSDWKIEKGGDLRII